MVMTYNEIGFYGHPDHIKTHEVTRAALEHCASVERLYYPVTPTSALTTFVAHATAEGVSRATTRTVVIASLAVLALENSSGDPENEYLGDGISESANYRVAVTTSTLFGLYGLGFIAVALLVLFGAVGRFGRR